MSDDHLLLLGPAMGPIAGGYIAQTVGVKWVFIVISSLSHPFLVFQVEPDLFIIYFSYTQSYVV